MPGTSERYARHLALPGFDPAAQAKLRDANVMLVGLGGLGSPAATYLAGAGVGHLIINDFDSVHESNLHRQILYTERDVGQRKPEKAAERISLINSETRLTVLDGRLNEEKLLAHVQAANLVLDGTDNFASRQSINDACVARDRPLVSGAVAATDGQIAIFPCDRAGPCYQCFLDNVHDNLADCEGTGILGPITGVIGSMMALEAIKLITGLGEPLCGRLLLFDGLNAEWKHLRVVRNFNCATCAS